MPQLVDVALRWALLAAIGLFAAVNLVVASLQIAVMLLGSDAVDWETYVLAGDRFWAGTLYQPAESWNGWRYSPVAVFPFFVLAPLGETIWRVLLLASLGALPRRLTFLALASYPLWFAIHAGSVMVLVVVAAYWALRGRWWAIGAFLVLALLIPRPLMVPIVIWILWKETRWRIPFAILIVVHLGLVATTGYLDDWVRVLIATGAEEIESVFNVAPSAIIGPAWLLLAIPLAVWAFRAGRPALSGLLLQPYWLPYYLLILLADPLPSRSWWRDHLPSTFTSRVGWFRLPGRGGEGAAEQPAAAPG
jgi:hypothetical protein